MMVKKQKQTSTVADTDKLEAEINEVPASQHTRINMYFKNGEIPKTTGLEIALQEHLKQLGWTGKNKDIDIADYDIREQLFNEGAIVTVNLNKPVTLHIGKDAPDSHELLVADLIKREADKWKVVLSQPSLSTWFIARALMLSAGKLDSNKVKDIVDNLIISYVPMKKEEDSPN